MRARALAFIACLSLSCAETASDADARQSEVVAAFVARDGQLIRQRPALVAGKYARMSGDIYSFYRGEISVFEHDWVTGAFGLSRSRFTVDGPRPYSSGDAHPENFGTLPARDGTFGLEPNDLDSADAWPYLWDVRRLAIGMCIAGNAANADDPAAQAKSAAACPELARAVGEGYSVAIAAHAAGAPRARFSDGQGSAVLVDLFAKSKADAAARSVLADTTVVGADGMRRFKRGVLDPASPTGTQADLPALAADALPAAIERYRASLISPPDAQFFRVLDAVRIFGSGVASWPRVRVGLLVSGPSDAPDDDWVLELKEEAESNVLPGPLPSVAFDAIPDRILGVGRAVWALPDADPFWGMTTWMGFPFQVKSSSGGERKVSVSRMTGARGTVFALTDLATKLGAELATMHAARADALTAIATAIAVDPSGFADEQSSVALSYAARVVSDWAVFQAAIGELRFTLGVPVDQADAVSPDLAAFYGTP